jgi:hypothetical protein
MTSFAIQQLRFKQSSSFNPEGKNIYIYILQEKKKKKTKTKEKSTKSKTLILFPV